MVGWVVHGVGSTLLLSSTSYLVRLEFVLFLFSSISEEIGGLSYKDDLN